MNESKAFPMEPDRYLVDTAWCDHFTEVAHHRMILQYYSLGAPLKDEQYEISRVGKIPEPHYQQVIANLLGRLGWKVIDGHWRHGRIELVMKQQQEKLLREINEAETGRGRTLNARKAKLQADSTSGESKFVRPTLDEVLAHGKTMHPDALPQHECRKFFSYFESKSWKVGKSPMKNWKAAMSHWRLNWLEHNGHIRSAPPVTLKSTPPPRVDGAEQPEAVLKKMAADLNEFKRTQL